MKKLRLIIASIFILVAMPLALPPTWCGSASAQASQLPIDRQLDLFSTKYKLSREQKASVRPLMEASRQRLAPLFDKLKTTNDQNERSAILKDIREEESRYHDELSEILTAAQMKAFDRDAEKRQKNGRKHNATSALMQLSLFGLITQSAIHQAR